VLKASDSVLGPDPSASVRIATSSQRLVVASEQLHAVASDARQKIIDVVPDTLILSKSGELG